MRRKEIAKSDTQVKQNTTNNRVSYDVDDINSYFNEDSNAEVEYDPNSSRDNRISLREISDDEPSDENDGKFVPEDFVLKSKPKTVEIAQEQENYLPPWDVIDDEPKVEIEPPRDSFRANVQPVNDESDHEEVKDKANKPYHDDAKNEDNKSYHESIKSGPKHNLPINTSGYAAEIESMNKQSVKNTSLMHSESSIRDAYDDYVMASGEEYAMPDPYSKTPIKKSVKFKKVNKLPSMSSEKDERSETEINEEREFISNLASYKDHTRLGGV